VRITLTDGAGNFQTLLIRLTGVEKNGTGEFALPPPPPQGVFDVRFSDDSRLLRVNPDATGDSFVPVRVQGLTPPVRVSWQMPGPSDRSLRLEWTSGERNSSLVLGGLSGSTELGSSAVAALAVRVDPLVRVFALAQNYPNPFNPATEIRFELPERTRVHLTVFDALGRAVARVLDEERLPGVHRISFNGEGLSSGVYFLRLESDRFTATRKMMLLK
jgi:hypothetical protein